MKNLYEIEGFNAYLFCMKTNRVWSKLSEDFMTLDDSGKYRMIKDDVHSCKHCLPPLKTSLLTLMTPMQVRQRAYEYKAPQSHNASSHVVKHWFVLHIVGSCAACVYRCDNEYTAKDAATNLSTKNPGSVYVVAEQTHRVQHQGLFWD